MRRFANLCTPFMQPLTGGFPYFFLMWDSYIVDLEVEGYPDNVREKKRGGRLVVFFACDYTLCSNRMKFIEISWNEVASWGRHASSCERVPSQISLFWNDQVKGLRMSCFLIKASPWSKWLRLLDAKVVYNLIKVLVMGMLSIKRCNWLIVRTSYNPFMLGTFLERRN